MNYQNIYNSLIFKAKSRDVIPEPNEEHHIIPRCLGGTDDKENLVKLTPEEHYVAHQLLSKMYPNSQRLTYAAVMMCANRPSNKLYGWIRRRLSKSQSLTMTGSGNNMFNKRWVSSDTETKLVGVDTAKALLGTGEYIAGKKAVRAPCGCLVKHRCIRHENKKELAYNEKRLNFAIYAKELFDEFLNSDSQSITQFAKLKKTSQPALTQLWKKHIPDYSMYVQHGKPFKKPLDN